MEEICNPVSAVWEEQEAEETSRSRAIASAALLSPSSTMHPVPQEHPSVPHEAARNLTGKPAGAARNPIQFSLTAFSALQTIVT